MKIIFFLIFISLMPFFISAYADIELTNPLKNNIEKQFQNNLRIVPMSSVLEELARQDFLSNIITDNQFLIPNDKKTSFVKLSGQIPEYGNTGSVIITILKPDTSDETIRASLLETGKYLTYFPVDHNSPKGLYHVFAKFGTQEISKSTFYLTSKITTTIPSWFNINFQWWLDENISDKEFLESTQFLIDSNIINLVLLDDVDHQNNLKVLVTGESMVRRGTTHTITSHISDGFNPIEGAKITLRIEDYGENEIRFFEGFSNNDGKFIFSWEIPKSFDDIETLLTFVSVSYGESSQTQLFKFQVYCLPGEKGCNVDGN